MSANIGSRIRKRRNQLGWSQSELARRMVDAGWPKYGQMAVSRTEDGRRGLRIDEAMDLVKVLQVSLLWLAYGDESTDLYAQGFSEGVTHVFNQINELKEQSNESF